jgi:uroporphyrinogen decarboxylase
MKKTWFPLSREEVTAALIGEKPPRVPCIRTKWWGDGLEDRYGTDLDRFNRFPEDAVSLLIDPIPLELMNLSWEIDTSGPHDTRKIISDWAQLDEFLDNLPKPESHPGFEPIIDIAAQAERDNRYILFGWWRLFFERPWGIRGMTQLLIDYYEYPDEVHRLHQGLADHYLNYLTFAEEHIKPQGFWVSDDLGHQENLFMSPAIFKEFIKPYYRQIGSYLQSKGWHWWLHSCGHNTPIIEDLIEVGVTVFHPVQKGTMDAPAVAREYGDRITFLAGMDVQHIMPEGSPDEVRREVRNLIDTFDRPEGKMCIAAGNGITGDIPLENIEAFLDEAYEYGTKHRLKFQRMWG